MNIFINVPHSDELKLMTLLLIWSKRVGLPDIEVRFEEVI